MSRRPLDPEVPVFTARERALLDRWDARNADEANDAFKRDLCAAFRQAEARSLDTADAGDEAICLQLACDAAAPPGELPGPATQGAAVAVELVQGGARRRVRPPRRWLGAVAAILVGVAALPPESRVRRAPDVESLFGPGHSEQRAEVVAVTPEPQVTLQIDSTPAGAEVRLAGVMLGTTPLDTRLPRGTGTVTFTVRGSGYRDMTITADISADYTSHVTLVPLPARNAKAIADGDRRVAPVGAAPRGPLQSPPEPPPESVYRVSSDGELPSRRGIEAAWAPPVSAAELGPEPHRVASVGAASPRSLQQRALAGGVCVRRSDCPEDRIDARGCCTLPAASAGPLTPPLRDRPPASSFLPEEPAEPELAPRESPPVESLSLIASKPLWELPVDAADHGQRASWTASAKRTPCELETVDSHEPACLERLRTQIAEQPPSLRRSEDAKALVNKAIAIGKLGDHRAAIALFIAAYRIAPHALLLSNLGAEYESAGAPEDALRYFCAYLVLDPAGRNAPFAKARARAMRAQLGLADQADVCARPEPAPTHADREAPASGVP